MQTIAVMSSFLPKATSIRAETHYGLALSTLIALAGWNSPHRTRFRRAASSDVLGSNRPNGKAMSASTPATAGNGGHSGECHGGGL